MWQVASIHQIGRYAAAVAATTLAVTATPASAQETYELSGDPAAIWNLAGVVTVTGGGSVLTVEVKRGGADAGRLEVATGAIDLDREGVQRVDALRVVYPGDEIAYDGGGAELHVRDDGTFYRGGHDQGRKVKILRDGSGIDAHADLDIRVPDGKTVRIYLAAGEVVVSNVDGDLTVSTGSADIRSSATSGQLVLNTGSGDVRLELPSTWESSVELDTSSGDIHSDFQLTIEEMDDDYVKGRVGTGGGSLEVDTGSGDIRLNRN